jgi:predicted RNase H-like HicB family nuclease
VKGGGMRTSKMDFYTIVLRQSGNYWVALCLENGLVGQGDTKETAVKKLRESIIK